MLVDVGFRTVWKILKFPRPPSSVQITFDGVQVCANVPAPASSRQEEPLFNAM